MKGPDMLLLLFLLLAVFGLMDLVAWRRGETLSRWLIMTSRIDRRFGCLVLAFILAAAVLLISHLELIGIVLGL